MNSRELYNDLIKHLKNPEGMTFEVQTHLNQAIQALALVEISESLALMNKELLRK